MLHKLQVLGMNDDLWDRVCELELNDPFDSIRGGGRGFCQGIYLATNIT